MNDVLKTIKSRRSVRKFKPEQIKQDELDLILEAAIYAPTAGNQQPWHFTVIRNQDVLRRINQTVKDEMSKSNVEWIKTTGSNPDFQVSYNAPVLIIVSGRKDGMAWQVDCSAAIQNMLLAAESLNIGSVWLGLSRFFFENNDAELLKLGIPEGYAPFYSAAFGYKADSAAAEAPNRNKDVVNYVD
jgi:Nitroreductase